MKWLSAASNPLDPLIPARPTEGQARSKALIAAKESQLAFELLLEIRNKLLESYQEIMRMQV